MERREHGVATSSRGEARGVNPRGRVWGADHAKAVGAEWEGSDQQVEGRIANPRARCRMADEARAKQRQRQRLGQEASSCRAKPKLLTSETGVRALISPNASRVEANPEGEAEWRG
jgi:hypothetical protein